MNGANSYNICPRCGNSNSLSSKYCSRCGGQLKVPEEPVVCHKCHTHNTPMANFCRNCGAQLRVGLETKICPKCGKEVDAHDSVCVCGYSFVTYQQANPMDPRNLPKKSSSPVRNDVATVSGDVRSSKSCRVVAILSILFMCLFGYFIMAPVDLAGIATRPAFLYDFDKGLTYGATVRYGEDFVRMALSKLFPSKLAYEHMGTANIIIAALVAATIATMGVQLIISIVRAVRGKHTKRLDWYYFAMFLASTIVVGLLLLFNSVEVHTNFFKTVQSWFLLIEDYKLGYAIWGIPVYYLFFFFMSFGARGKALKEER